MLFIPYMFTVTHIFQLNRVTWEWHPFRGSTVTPPYPHIVPLALCNLSGGTEMSHLSIGKAYCFRGLPLSCTGQSCWRGGGGTMGPNRLGPLWLWKVYKVEWKSWTFPACYYVIWHGDCLTRSMFSTSLLKVLRWLHQILINFFLCLLLSKTDCVWLQYRFLSICSGNFNVLYLYFHFLQVKFHFLPI